MYKNAQHACLFLILTALLANAMAEDRVRVIAHRGEHLRHPENTMPAFEEAVRVGADYVEVDVRTTVDGKLILMHDSTVDRTTNGHGEVAKMTFDEIRALTAGGAQVPAFDEVLEYARGKIGVYVDAKAISARDIVDRLKKGGEFVIYADPRLAKEVQALDSRLKVMPEARSAERAQQLIDDLHLKVLAFDAKDFTPDVIAVAKKAGVQIFVDRLGPFDNPASWQKAVDEGAAGIQTDHPEELVKYLRKTAAAYVAGEVVAAVKLVPVDEEGNGLKGWMLCGFENEDRAKDARDYTSAFRGSRGFVPPGTYFYRICGPHIVDRARPNGVTPMTGGQAHLTGRTNIILAIVDNATRLGRCCADGSRLEPVGLRGRVNPAPAPDNTLRLNIHVLNTGRSQDVEIAADGAFYLPGQLRGPVSLTVIRGSEILHHEIVRFNHAIGVANLELHTGKQLELRSITDQ